MAWISLGDPVPLPLGTEVSAKYRGAFCEATIKQVRQDLLCKVVFTHNGDTLTIPSKHITGTIAINRVVSAVHPDDRQAHNAVIRKIKDQSQYTVEFDDGDIKTLKRNFMQMKGKRHYEDEETLDVNPLTDPENFSAPVNMEEDTGRRRRSASGDKRGSDSEDDGDEDDEEGDEDDSSEEEEEEEEEGDGRRSRLRGTDAQKAAFTKAYEAFMEGRGTAVKKVPQLGYKNVDLYKLYNLVTEKGGMEQVTKDT
eukprot:Opistho-2@9703